MKQPHRQLLVKWKSENLTHKQTDVDYMCCSIRTLLRSHVTRLQLLIWWLGRILNAGRESCCWNCSPQGKWCNQSKTSIGVQPGRWCQRLVWAVLHFCLQPNPAEVKPLSGSPSKWATTTGQSVVCWLQSSSRLLQRPIVAFVTRLVVLTVL